jgi:type I restriction enzyme S subunit
MPNIWKTYKLGEITAYQKGFAFKSDWFKDKGDLVVRVSDTTQNSIDVSTCHRIDKEKSNELQKYKLEKDDIVIATVGSWPPNFASVVGKVVKVPLEADGALLNQNAVRLKSIDEDFFSKKYIYYLMKSDYFLKYIVNTAQGSANQASIKLTDIFDFKFDIPCFKEQKSIATILSTIDDKIENNLAINITLEEMAMALYKHWFVDFGPFQDGEFVESELGKIPKGWKIVQFRELLSLLKDGSHNPPKRVDSGVKFIAGATDIKKLEVTFNKCSYITQDDYNKMHKTWEIKENDILMTIVGTIGNTAIVQNKDLPFSLQRSIAIFRPIEEIPNYFIYLLINNESFKEYVKAHTNPTGQPGIYLKILGSYVLAQPNFQILKQFNDVIEPLFDQMFSNLTENQTLTQLRDTLLPKLISGAVRLKEFQES